MAGGTNNPEQQSNSLARQSSLSVPDGNTENNNSNKLHRFRSLGRMSGDELRFHTEIIDAVVNKHQARKRSADQDHGGLETERRQRMRNIMPEDARHVHQAKPVEVELANLSLQV